MEGVEPRLTPKSLQESPRQPSSSGVVKGHLDHTFYSRARQALVERSLSGCFVSPLSTLPAAAQRRVPWTLPIEHSPRPDDALGCNASAGRTSATRSGMQLGARHEALVHPLQERGVVTIRICQTVVLGVADLP